MCKSVKSFIFTYFLIKIYKSGENYGFLNKKVQIWGKVSELYISKNISVGKICIFPIFLIKKNKYFSRKKNKSLGKSSILFFYKKEQICVKIIYLHIF